jgi:Trm5-related predicted tRNA methylase
MGELSVTVETSPAYLITHFFLVPDLAIDYLVISVKLVDEHSVYFIGYLAYFELENHALATIWISPPRGEREVAGVNVKLATLSEPAYPTILVDVSMVTVGIEPKTNARALSSEPN